MRLRLLFLYSVLSTLTFFYSTSIAATVITSTHATDDPFIKTWLLPFGNITYSLKIEANPPGNKHHYHITYQSPSGEYESDTCDDGGYEDHSVIICGLYSPPAFFAGFKLNNWRHSITIYHLTWVEPYDFYDPDYLRTNARNIL